MQPTRCSLSRALSAALVACAASCNAGPGCLHRFTSDIQDEAPAAHGHATAEEMNKSNNPLNPAPALNLQDSYVPELFGSDAHTNDAFLRFATPLPPMGFVPVPQLIRVTAPISTRPDDGDGYTTGLGDVNVFDILLLGKPAGVELGVGPLLTMPTAAQDELGSEKWSAGVAAVAIAPSERGLIGGLLQWQASFAGSDLAPDVDVLTAQPFVIHNLPQAWYLRSTAIWTFDLENDMWFIPIGLGAGKVWKARSTTLNAFVEPQWTAFHDGDGLPQFAVFAGLNCTFGGRH